MVTSHLGPSQLALQGFLRILCGLNCVPYSDPTSQPPGPQNVTFLFQIRIRMRGDPGTGWLPNPTDVLMRKDTETHIEKAMEEGG